MATIRDITLADSTALAAIYNHFVEHTTISFEEQAISPAQMGQRIENVSASYPYLALEKEGALLGYAYGSLYRQRPAYRFTVETTIYMHAAAAGKGYGSRLYRGLLTRLAADGFKTALGVIALPNPASVRLHEKLGFKKIGQLEQVGRKFGRWIDTSYWQLHLDQWPAAASA